MSQLTPAEMATLTDAKVHARQIAVLRENSIPFAISAKGRPVTTWEVVNKALSGAIVPRQTGPISFHLEAASE